MRKTLAFFIALLLMFAFSCEDNEDINLDKNTYYDDISDITYLQEYFYTTNYDLSGNAGSQIDLFKFSSNGTYIIDKYDLEMNGQGYLAITNDGDDLYLQSRNFSFIVKTSPVGEKAYIRSDTVNFVWQASGICYIDDIDSLLILYKNSEIRNQYRARIVDKDLIYPVSRDIMFEWDFIDTTYYGAYAIAYKDNNFYLLGVDTSLTDILIVTDYDFNVISTENIPDSTVVGLCFKDDDLYFSYRDRRIEKWKSY